MFHLISWLSFSCAPWGLVFPMMVIPRNCPSLPDPQTAMKSNQPHRGGYVGRARFSQSPWCIHPCWGSRQVSKTYKYPICPIFKRLQTGSIVKDTEDISRTLFFMWNTDTKMNGSNNVHNKTKWLKTPQIKAKSKRHNWSKVPLLSSPEKISVLQSRSALGKPPGVQELGTLKGPANSHSGIWANFCPSVMTSPSHLFSALDQKPLETNFWKRFLLREDHCR